MKTSKKIYCRLYQFGFRLLLPFLPYRQPKVLESLQNIPALLKCKKIEKVLLVTDSGIYNLGLTKSLEEELSKNKIQCSVYSKTVPNPTIDNIEEAVRMYKNRKCEALIAFGGGSAMDCCKMVGARVVRPNKKVPQMKGLLKVGKKLPLLIAVPTTAGTGSETTLAAVITDTRTKHKYAINDFNLIPHYAVLDENLTLNLPKHITSTTGMDALTHAIEAYIGQSTTPQTRKMALEASKLIFENLEKVYENGQDKVARKNMLRAAYCAGVAFTKSFVGYVHAVAHTLGGQYGVPHGLANAVILPYMLKYYGESAYTKLKKIAVYCGIAKDAESAEKASKKLIKRIENMNKAMDIPNTITQIKESDIKQMAQFADAEGNPLYPVPKLMDQQELEKIYYAISQ